MDAQTNSSNGAGPTPASPSPTAMAEKKTRNIALGIVLLANLGLAYWTYGIWVTEVQSEKLTQLSLQQAQRQADTIGAGLQRVQESMNRFVARSTLAAALLDNNKKVLTKLNNSLKKIFPDAIAMRFFLFDKAALSDDKVAPIRFTELDMIRRAEKGESVKPEAAKINDKWLLHRVVALPAENKQTTVGTLLLSFPENSIAQLFDKSNLDLGKTEVLQHFANSRPQLLSFVGAGNAGPSQEATIVNSHWKIRFTPSALLQQQSQINPLPLASALILIALISMAIALQTAKLINRRRRDQRQASNLVGTLAKSGKTSDAPWAKSPHYRDHDILDIEVADEDQNLLGLQESRATDSGKDAPEPAVEETTKISQVAFRAYDIRGTVGKELTPELIQMIGQAVASEALDLGETTLVVARDGRVHSPAVTKKLVQGILSTGCNVINIGLTPTPLLYYAVEESTDTKSGIMVTGSHNAAEDNGFKLVLKGKTFADDDIQQLRSRILRRHFHQGQGSEDQQNVIPEYIEKVFADVALAGEITIVIDAGNGATGEVAPLLFEELGCNVIALHCDIDGNFPNRGPDPAKESNLQDLLNKVQQTNADLGVAFDGDGDRLMVVTPKAEIIWPDRLLMLFAKDIVSRCPGADVIFDVKSTRQLNGLITSYGGRPVMWKSGHSYMKAKMLENNAILGGEFSGHIFIKDRWYGFDDAMYAAARLIEIMSLRDQDLDTIFSGFPLLPATPELKINVAEKKKFDLIRKLISQGDFQDGKFTTIDGLRVDFEKGWGLVRASNTSPALTLRFEGESEEAIEQLQQLFKQELLKVDAGLSIEF